MIKLNKLNILKDSTDFNSQYDILSYINENQIDIIYVFNDQFLINYIVSIKTAFPEILINYYSYSKNKDIILYLNYVNSLYVSDNDIYNYYNSYITNIEIINLITFGTFDLFHIGHTNIFTKCAEYSNNITVGLSSDQFTFEKKQIYPYDSFNKRKENILQCKNVKEVFAEESMDLKNEYIKNYNSNILVMGDDWKDKFDWVDCCVIYFKRTPDICSTMLREEIKSLSV